MMRRLGTVVASLLLAGAGAGLMPAPAQAAYCTSSGVHAVVEFRALGGGAQTGCMNTTSEVTASRVFPAAGFPMTYVTAFPGAVCRVKGVPQTSCADMPPASAYWGLFHTDSNGRWFYSQRGVTTLRVAPGASVAWVWQDGGATEYPATAPGSPSVTKPAAKPKPAPKPAPGTSGSTGSGTSGGATSGGTGSSSGTLPAPGTPEATALAQLEQAQKQQTQQKARQKKAQAQKKKQAQKAQASVSASPTDEPSTSAVSAATSDEESVGGRSVSPWIPVGIIAALIAAGATAVLLRRRAG